MAHTEAPTTGMASAFVILAPLEEMESTMSEYRIFHNPRCSKSRQTLALLEEQGVTPEVVLYLETPPSRSELELLADMLGKSPAEWIRRGEEEYKASGLDKDSSAAELIDAMAAHPRLIERPIVVRGKRAVLGRPPENVRELLD